MLLVLLCSLAIERSAGAATVIGTVSAIYLAAAGPETVAVAAPVVAASGPVGWIVGGSILAILGLVGLVSWLFGRKASSPSSLRYVTGTDQASSAAVHSLSPQQTQKLTKNALKISSFHVSCKSDHPTKENTRRDRWNAIGIVLFEYDGKDDFRINHIHCKAGYIVLMSSVNIPKKNEETYHAACFRTIFGKSHKKLDKTLIGGGFSVQNGKCVFNSATFNCGAGNVDRYHFGTRTMNPLIQHCVQTAVKNWIDKKQQNSYVKDMEMISNHTNLLCVHPDYSLSAQK